MDKVTQEEIVEALQWVGCASSPMVRHSLADRIQSEGIEPPEGYKLVKIVVPLTDAEWIREINAALDKREALRTPAPKPEDV